MKGVLGYTGRQGGLHRLPWRALTSVFDADAGIAGQDLRQGRRWYDNMLAFARSASLGLAAIALVACAAEPVPSVTGMSVLVKLVQPSADPAIVTAQVARRPGGRCATSRR